jgi:hypothetical protein
LAVLAVAFASLSTLQTRNLTLTAEDQELTQGTLAARDIFAQLQSGMLPLEDDEDKVGKDHPDWRWRLRIEDTELEELQRIEVTVFKKGDDPEEGLTFWSFSRKQVD